MSVVHCVAQCSDCDFEETDYIVAGRKAREHAKKTGHEVIVETGTYRILNDKNNRVLIITPSTQIQP